LVAEVLVNFWGAILNFDTIW